MENDVKKRPSNGRTHNGTGRWLLNRRETFVLNSMDINILSQQFCAYSLSFKGYSKNTIRRYRTTISSFSKFTGITTLDQVTDENIRQLFYTGRIERRWSVNTYIGYRKTLLVFFRWCVKNRYLEKNPVLDIEVPKMEKRLPTKLTKQDSMKLLELVYNYPYDYTFLRYRNHAIFSTFIFAGLRRQELLNLKYADVDTENLTLLIRQGKGN